MKTELMSATFTVGRFQKLITVTRTTYNGKQELFAEPIISVATSAEITAAKRAFKNLHDTQTLGYGNRS